nr:MAG TPA: hypothetical protein [Caudoviricetes sp.]
MNKHTARQLREDKPWRIALARQLREDEARHKVHNTFSNTPAHGDNL